MLAFIVLLELLNDLNVYECLLKERYHSLVSSQIMDFALIEPELRKWFQEKFEYEPIVRMLNKQLYRVVVELFLDNVF